MHRFFSPEEYDEMMQYVGEATASGKPFCVFRLPKKDNLTTNFVVEIPEFDDRSPHRIAARVKPWLSSVWFDFSTSANPAPEIMNVCPESTSEEEYTASLTELIDILKKRGGKTVICRNICGKFNNCKLAEIFARYLTLAPADNCVTFLLWHPSMNFWMGSTPELILERRNDGRYGTAALAGTRHSSVNCGWDMKNIEEHNFVVNDIDARLRLSGIDFFRMPTREITYGTVTHLQTELISKFVENGHDRRFFDRIVEEIQPTPALAGYPRPIAISEIERFEKWPRHLYAGCLNIAEIRVNMTYGIIRCVHFDSEKWAVYTGSGVTADSYPSVEWIETENKAKPLLDCLKEF